MAKRIEPVDVLVGQRVRAYRLARRMSQTALAEKVGVTFQQVQKYEKGTNRIGSSRLKKISNVLGVGIASLFAEEDGGDRAGEFGEILSHPDAARLLGAFSSITEAKLRAALVTLAEGIGQRGR